MQAFERTPAPAWLEEKAGLWGRDWKMRQSKGKPFRWRKNKKKGYDDLLRDLNLMTEYHCAFCDNFPLVSGVPCEVEHFLPKSKFPLSAYTWSNLYPSCRHCQEKGSRFDERLLKPDDKAYSFDDYFEIEWESGRIRPNITKSPENQERARTTIEIYGWNKKGRPTNRKRWLGYYPRLREEPIDALPFRFMLSRIASGD